MNNVPILVMSDCPSQSSGLARITRDLCTVLSTMPEFRVASLGWMGSGRRDLPFQTYHMRSDEFGERSLPGVWDDWSKGQPGIVLTVWDLSRLLWLAQPDLCEIESTRKWLTEKRHRQWQLWSYVPVDSTGPNNRLTEMSREVLAGIDRIVAYSPWAQDVIANTIGPEAAHEKGLTWLPHAINGKIFKPGLREANNVPLIGVLGTNQHRKDWGLVASVCSGLLAHFKGQVKFWWHLDRDLHYWSIPALVADFNLGEHIEITYTGMTDTEMAERYRACDVTLHPGLGEGFGYPIFESLACGVPAIHGDYAGGASIMRTCGLENLVVPVRNWRLEGQMNCLRPVFDPRDWVVKILEVLNSKPADLQNHVDHLAWRNLAHPWKRWFREGLHEVKEPIRVKCKGVVHVGIHTGEELGDYIRDGRQPIICFDPQDMGVKGNIRMALSDRNGLMDLNIPVHLHDDTLLDTASASGLKLIPENARANGWTPTFIGQRVAVDAIRFDAWAQRDGYVPGSCDLLVIDVQGMELQVLKGFGERLRDFTEIKCECSEPALYEGGASGTEVVSWLSEDGFDAMTPVVKHGDVWFRRRDG